jgi:hypothetical protein
MLPWLLFMLCRKYKLLMFMNDPTFAIFGNVGSLFKDSEVFLLYEYRIVNTVSFCLVSVVPCKRNPFINPQCAAVGFTTIAPYCRAWSALHMLITAYVRCSQIRALSQPGRIKQWKSPLARGPQNGLTNYIGGNIVN